MFFAGSGRCAEARAETSRAMAADSNFTPTGHAYAAVTYAVCGDRAAAVRETLKAIEGGVETDVRSNPDLEAVREDPAVRDLLRAKRGS
jgi:hypothetical protein